MSFKVDESHILATYRILKTYAYYENLNLFLKSRLAEFETTYIHPLAATNVLSTDESVDISPEIVFTKFSESLANSENHPFNKLIAVLNSDSPRNHPFFEEWLNKIDFRLFVKGLTEQKKGSIFLTNKKVSDGYKVEKFNYFIDAPIELHIVEIMWSVLAGKSLDDDLTTGCYGNRLSDHAKLFRTKFYDNDQLVRTQGELFNRYVEQYGQWRDGALNAAKRIVEEKSNTAIFSLDLKSYFYNIDISFESVINAIEARSLNPVEKKFEVSLCELLEAVHQKYCSVISPYLESTHPDEMRNQGIPIGMASSSILANWHLNSLDTHITRTIRPVFYGRYVDDLIFVFRDPAINDDDPDQTVDHFFKSYFKGVLAKKKKGEKNYRLSQLYHELPIQGDKLVLHFFDKEHTMAGLDVFQKELEERSSAFRFLPDDHIEADLEKFSYDVVYDGSANKFRSVIGLAENETELSKFLSSHIIAHRLCKITPKHDPIPKLRSFFRGENLIRFYRLWEKVFSYALIKSGKEQIEFAKKFHSDIAKLIDLTSGLDCSKNISEKLTQRLRTDLREYLGISVCMPLALLGKKAANGTVEPYDSPHWVFGYQELVNNLRRSNIFRHSYVAWPLLNFTEFDDKLCDPDFLEQNSAVNLSQIKLALSPRFIHFEEWQVLSAYQRVRGGTGQGEFDDFTAKTASAYQENWFETEFPIEIDEGDSRGGGALINHIKIGTNGMNESDSTKLKVAIANLRVEFSDIERAYRGDKKPNVEFKRQETLWKILNEAERLNVKLLVLPEVSIPVSWLPFMVAHARRHQIALIFGLEHWVNGDFAYNLIVEAFPFKISGKYNSCLVNIRVKNHYAPEEKRQLEKFRLKPAEPAPGKWVYNLVNWQGIQLASYNCFELANIEHRSLFRSELDLLVACVWNKDTSYYDHILQSATRDLFCFVIQSNTSQYGGSCVLKPSRSIEADIIKVKGGDNGCILTTELDIAGIRDAQHKSTRGPEDAAYKVTPPGYDHEIVKGRSK